MDAPWPSSRQVHSLLMTRLERHEAALAEIRESIGLLTKEVIMLRKAIADTPQLQTDASDTSSLSSSASVISTSP